MATTETSARKVYRDSREQLTPHITERVFAMIMGCGDLRGRTNIAKKLYPADKPLARGVTVAESLAAQLLVVLDRDGYDLERFQFDDEGRLIATPKMSDPESPDLPRVRSWNQGE